MDDWDLRLSSEEDDKGPRPAELANPFSLMKKTKRLKKRSRKIEPMDQAQKIQGEDLGIESPPRQRAFKSTMKKTKIPKKKTPGAPQTDIFDGMQNPVNIEVKSALKLNTVQP